jgi:hypothetical protein
VIFPHPLDWWLNSVSSRLRRHNLGLAEDEEDENIQLQKVIVGANCDGRNHVYALEVRDSVQLGDLVD